jgi:hypothetical protein
LVAALLRDLTFGQRQIGLLLDPRQCLLGNDLLGPVEAREENAGRLADRIGDDRSLGQFQI